MNEITQLIDNYYQREEDIKSTLCYQYATHVGELRTRELIEVLGYKTIENNTFIDEDGVQQQFTIK